ncbi:4-sulfomuconolactone hydrolase [Pigmentiphaga humi]|uniref:4-sulfomuconolactone hydrolase n=1 Tax=Pigmentiphaga humi TaxID=2478468 RepID=A0A3P4AYF8_9BURK|nr:amidohydrolase family protein [Pigmentiphaga humi]VCU69099.1 4-sulfomuconolactone hydrolase [Pigmentiphaga humi]
MPSRILDIHPHIITTDTETYPRAPLGGNQSGWSRDRPTTTEQLLAAMDAAGVAKAAIVQSSTCYGFDNSYVADAVAAHPDRFTGVFSVDVLADDAPQRIREWVVDRKLTGLRLFTTGSTMPGQASWLADPRTFPAWECARELGIPVCVQMRAEGFPQLQEILSRFPEVPIILDHLWQIPLEEGPPYTAADALYQVVRYPNVYLKLTSVTMDNARKGKASPETYLPRVVSEFGADRIAWGSNFPATPGTLKEILDDSLAALAWASEADKEHIFRRTAEKLYPALAGHAER